MDFGAFVELFPGTDGLLHVSQISKKRVRSVSDCFKEGDMVTVSVLEVDRDGKIRLSHKEFEKEGEFPAKAFAGPGESEGRGGEREGKGERPPRDKDREHGGGGRRGRR
jgi:polyribonucleotide nucleotidyltransferase